MIPTIPPPRNRQPAGQPALGLSSMLAWLVVSVLVVDFIFYGWMLPICGTYVAGAIAVSLNLSPFLEICLIAVCVFLFLLIVLHLNLERVFWKHIFAGDPDFKSVLKIRDLINIATIFHFLRMLFTSILDMIQDKGMKERYLSEGVGYVVLRPFADETIIKYFFDACQCSVLPLTIYEPQLVDESFLGYFTSCWTWISCYFANSAKDIICEKCLLKDKFIHGARFALAIGYLTAAISKAVYFNTLYAYIGAMDIFRSMEWSPRTQRQMDHFQQEQGPYQLNSELSDEELDNSIRHEMKNDYQLPTEDRPAHRQVITRHFADRSTVQ